MRLSSALIASAALILASHAHAQCPDSVYVRLLAPPDYPQIAIIAKLQGTVKVNVEIAKDGKVTSASASGAHQILNDLSKENAMKWIFSSYSAEPQACRLTITYVYKIEGKPSYHPRPHRVVLKLPTRVEITAQPGIPNP